MNRSTALLISSALLLPAAALVAPAQAATDASTDTVTNCSKSRHGVTVRIKIRDEGSFSRVRVSHPRGTGNFYAPKVRWTRHDSGQVGGGVSLPPPSGTSTVRTAADPGDDGNQNKPSFRIPFAGPGTGIAVVFKLRNGHRISMFCGVS
jgi:hypothetical protein